MLPRSDPVRGGRDAKLRAVKRPSRETLAAGGCGAVLLLLVWRGLLLEGLVPSDGNTIAFSFPHWSSTRELLGTWSWPLWNPWRNLGEPHLADPQSLALYPPFWLLAPLRGFASFLAGWVVFHSALAAGFTWRWVRESRGDAAAAAAGALVVALNAFFIARVTLPNHLAAAAWLPVVLYYQTRGRTAALGVALALQWLAGFPPFALLTGVAALALAAFQRRAGLLRLAAASALAAGLAAIQLLPFLQMVALSSRGALLSAEAVAQYSLDLPLLAKQLLLPQWFAFAPEMRGDPAIVMFYVGPVALAAAILAVLRGAAVERRVALGAALAALLALGNSLPFYEVLRPLHVFRFPANWLLLVAMGATWLTAAGVARLPRPSWRWAAVALLALDLVAFAWPTRTAWIQPGFFESPPAWAEGQVHRIYQTRSLRNLWIRGGLASAGDYESMREYLAPSFGTAFGIGEVRSYQVLGSRRAHAFEQRLAAEAPDSPLWDWADVGTIVAAAPGATRIEPGAVQLRKRPMRHGRAFVPGGGSARFTEYRAGRATIQAELPAAGRLVFSETALPGWQVAVDGKSAKVERFADTFLAASVPAGEHRVTFVYRPWPFVAGRLISGAALFLLVGYTVRRRTGSR